MPYVVRPTGKVKYKENLSKEALQVVGPCYPHGIINGEIFTDRDAPRFSRLKWTRLKWTRLNGDTAASLEEWMILI